jgi:hypothetical protein
MRVITGFRFSPALFWACIVFSVCLRLAMAADLSVLVIYAPHDDGLYVSRAFHLISGNAFGPYDARLLIKFPGISLWLAGVRLIGIPYLLSINLLYIAAGVYFIAGLMRCKVDKRLIFIVFVIYLFNHVTFGYEWIRPVREPLSTSLLVILLSAMIFIFEAIGRQRFAVLHVLSFSVVFGFALLVREEDILLYSVLILFALAVLIHAWSAGGLRTAASRWKVVFVIALPLLAANLANLGTRAFVAEHYGLPIIHDFGEGEFPKLIAAMRSVTTSKDNRLVMVTQEGLRLLQKEVPKLTPVIMRLPPPDKDTYSCQRYGVCSEWANGWMPFWIKDAAYQAGLTPDLPTAQEYFRNARLDIEQACQEGRLKCIQKGSGLIPPFELRWTRAYVQEWFTLMGMTLMPHIDHPKAMPQIFSVDPTYGRIYQVVTMTHQFDTLLEATRNKSVALPRYDNSLEIWRETIISAYEQYWIFLEIAGFLTFLVRLRLWKAVPPSPLTYVTIVFTGYAALRQAALAYLAVYMGHFDPRLVFPTYSAVLLIAPLMIAEGLTALWKARLRHEPATIEGSRLS